ncbi:MAG: hypothetical protein HYS57_02930, partial [Parcubacteria group bacterium]|nr:hypothetical protein [Parcubacteria group bacterium]
MLIFSLVALVVLLAWNFVVGMYFKFGVKHNWFFEVNHFIGGFLLAMVFSNFFHSFWLILVLVLVAGVLWECFEYVTGSVPIFSQFLMKIFRVGREDVEYVWKNIWRDTLLDLALALAGASVFLVAFNY